MSIGIINLIRKCDHSRVAFAVGTLLAGVMSVIPAVTLSPTAGVSAAEEEAIERLIRDRACVGCDLHEADFRRLDLTNVDLRGADLEGANFYYANLDGAQLEGANLIDVNLSYASVRGVDLDGADLRYAIFDHTDLTNSSMVDTDLRESYIEEANFTNAVLDGANMEDTLFFSADFSVAASLCGAITWAGTEYREGCQVIVPTEVDDKF